MSINYLTIEQLKELIKDMPDDGQVYFSIDKADEELYWRDEALVRTGEAKDGYINLVGKKVSFQEHQNLVLENKILILETIEN
jgi:hypothetical protein